MNQHYDRLSNGDFRYRDEQGRDQIIERENLLWLIGYERQRGRVFAITVQTTDVSIPALSEVSRGPR